MRQLWVACGCLMAVSLAGAEVWPDQIGAYKRVSMSQAAIQDRPLWDEYGLELAEQASYAAGPRQFTGTAFRLKDPTSAFAVFEWQRPPSAKSSQLADVAAETRDGAMFLFGNYVFQLDGWKPKSSDLNPLLAHLPRLDQSALPSNYLPAKDLVPNSQRYVIGPVGLDRFERGVPPAVAAFSMGAEVEIAQYDTSIGPMQLAVFSYPTPQIARLKVQEFQGLAGARAKRAGPLVAVILSPKSADAAEVLLSRVSYNAQVTTDERVPTKRDNVADLLLNIFMLTGIIVALFAVAGIAVGLLRHLGWGTSGDPMTLLHLEDRSHDSTQS